MFGAVYYILPRVTGVEFPLPKLVRGHFWSYVLGVLLLVVPLAAGGVVQGLKLLDADVAFVDVTRSTLPFLRVSTIGDALIALGNLFFLFNVGSLIVRYGRSVCSAAYATATAQLEPAEVNP
jgi:cytochrome c oxidase cbb3-type subunit I